MPTPTELLQEHAPDGVLSPQEAANLLELAEQGDIGASTPNQGTAPAAAPAVDDGTKTANPADTTDTNNSATDDRATGAATDVDPAEAVVLAKDGVHTIPYQKLIDAREGEKQWRAQAEAAQLELGALKAQAQQRVDAGAAPTQTDANVATAAAAVDKGVDAAIFGTAPYADGRTPRHGPAAAMWFGAACQRRLWEAARRGRLHGEAGQGALLRVNAAQESGSGPSSGTVNRNPELVGECSPRALLQQFSRARLG